MLAVERNSFDAPGTQVDRQHYIIFTTMQLLLLCKPIAIHLKLETIQALYLINSHAYPAETQVRGKHLWRERLVCMFIRTIRTITICQKQLRSPEL